MDLVVGIVTSPSLVRMFRILELFMDYSKSNLGRYVPQHELLCNSTAKVLDQSNFQPALSPDPSVPRIPEHHVELES
jgi:hypothetical protein